jgi:hypothetical protein
MQEETHTCKECGKTFSGISTLNRHVRCHEMTYEAYVLKWKYNNVRPVCKCGCGKQTNWNVALKDFARHVLGHSAWGRKKSDEEKKKIGRKNSERQKRYFAEHPEIAKLKSAQMRSGITPEVQKRRLITTKKTYEQMTFEDKQKFSEHAKKLWSESRDLMIKASVKGGATFKKRAAAGEYDLKTRNNKISEKLIKLYMDGGRPWSTGNYTSTKTGKTIYYRSSWELQYAQTLDADPNVLTWEYEWESVSYTIDNITHRYIPDFHVVLTSGKHLFVEIKPKALVSTAKNVAKRDAALKLCEQRGWQYVTLTFS